MGKEERRKRDGTGPYKNSFRIKGEGKEYGHRQEAGEECPVKKSKRNMKIVESFW